MPPAPPPFRIRRAEAGDGPDLAVLVLALMAHLGDPPHTFDAGRFLGDAFGPQPQFDVLVAESDSVLIGYALFHDAYEPAYAARGVYLSDVYVTPGRRREGVGRALLARVAREATARGRTFIWWVSRTDEARGFYRTLANVEQPVTAHAVTFAAFDRLLG
jgi:GNAT superfamily N-acetyltransferase